MREYFCGWYFKCQSASQTLAVIPAVHTSREGRSASVQLLTDTGAWNLCFPYEVYRAQKRDLRIRVGENTFGEDGVSLNLTAPGLTAVGTLRFGPLTPIRYDIMGPFRFVPFMECRHSVVSMRHTVNGEVCVNGEEYRFSDAVGYIEGDRGHSFPRVYAWTQCCFDGGSLMLSVAEIPVSPFHFTGIIGVIMWQGKEYRLATYLGAKVAKIENGEVTVRQGDMVFTAALIEKHPHPLFAPTGGVMSRIIHESAACRAAYRFEKNGQTLFSFESEYASFEYEYPN